MHVLRHALFMAASTRSGGGGASPAPASPPPAAAAAPAPAATDGAAAAGAVVTPPAPPPEFKIARRVTLPVLKLNDDVPVYVYAIKPLYEGKEMKGSGQNAQMKPATLLDVVDIRDGEVKQVVAGTVLASVLRENYPNDGYVGKEFSITKRARAADKRYNAYDVLEIQTGKSAQYKELGAQVQAGAAAA